MLPSMATPAAADNDPRNLHDLAVDVQTDLQKLATGLAHAGAAPQAVQTLTKMAQVIAQVSKQLAAGPVGGQSGPAGASAQQAPQAAPQSPQAPQPQPQAPQAPQAAPARPAPGQAHGALHAAVHGLHQAAIAAANERRQ